MLHGNRTYLLMNDDGQIEEAHSISAGLDYPGIGPEHAWLNDMGRVKFLSATDEEALEAFQLCSKLEGIIPALEPAHALAKVPEIAPTKAEGSPDGGQSFAAAATRISTVGRGVSGKQDRQMTTRIDQRFAALKDEGRAALVTFIMAGDPDPDTSLAILKALPKAGADIDRARHAVHRSDGRRPGDPGRGPARAQGAARTWPRRSHWCATFRKGDDATPIVLMGYYNPIYIYGVERFLADAKAAGVDGLIVVDLPPEEDDELCLPALKAGPQLHPAGDADDRRQAPAGRARQHVGLRLLRLDHRHHRHGGARCRARSPRAVARIKRHTKLAGRGRLRRARPPSRRAPSRGAPTAWWSARRWSMRCADSLDKTGKADAGTVKAVTELVDSATGVQRRALCADVITALVTHSATAVSYYISSRSAVYRKGSHELDLQRRPAEDPQLPDARDAGESLDQVSGDRPARVLQGRRGEPVRHSRLELPHAHGRGGAAEVACSTTANWTTSRCPKCRSIR